MRDRTGLVVDAYFSGTKLAWLLDHVPGARAAAERGALAFGTIDSFLLWRLTGGRVHATDATNASRTMLFDIRAQRWDASCCARCACPSGAARGPRLLGRIRRHRPALFGAAIPITGIAGDQQAATVRSGLLRARHEQEHLRHRLLHAGQHRRAVSSSGNRLLTTVAYAWAAAPPTRWRAASSSPARPCNGCATACT